MENASGDLKELSQYLAEGYLIHESVQHLGRLSPHEIDEFISLFSIKTDAAILLGPSNHDKYLTILVHPTASSRVELITSDNATMQRVISQLGYQNEPVGTLILARCVAVDNRIYERPANHMLDRLVESLNGFWDWTFTLLEEEPPAFQVEMRLKSLDKGDIELAKEKLKGLLDCLAVSQHIGFYVQQISEGPIRRSSLNLYAFDVGPTERRLETLDVNEIENIEAALMSPKTKTAAKGLNQAYAENFIPSKLALLWAAVEEVFAVDTTQLLNRREIKILMKAALDIGTLGSDSERMDDLKQALEGFKRQSKNRHIATLIAPIMGMEENEVLNKLQIASKVRGRILHGKILNINSIRDDWDKILTSIDFLQQVLRRYLAQQMN